MIGSRKLASMLFGAFVMLFAFSASGQQPSNAADDTRQETSAAPAPTAPRWPENMPPNLPKVTCAGDQLTISAQNSTLGAVLSAIRTCIKADIDVPEDARGERLFAELGPGPVRAVLADFLSSTDFDYVIKASPSDPQKVQMVLLNPRPKDSTTEVAAVVDSSDTLSLNRRAWIKARENYTQSFTAAQDEPTPQTDAAASASAPVETVATAPANAIPMEAPPADPPPAAAAAAVVASPAAIGTASIAADSGAAQSQGKTTQEMISDMQRMFEQRKQMIQQQAAPVH